MQGVQNALILEFIFGGLFLKTKKFRLHSNWFY
jgi:hypothetical protein